MYTHVMIVIGFGYSRNKCSKVCIPSICDSASYNPVLLFLDVKYIKEEAW